MVPGSGGQLQAMQMQTSSVSSAAPTQATMASEPTEEEPLYVNAKQYNRILKRRAARAKLESEGRIPRERKVCDVECIVRRNRRVFCHFSVNSFTNRVTDMR